jgi:Dolichyl-phosphate-mannose-protein mannosyltransferase
MFTERSTTSYTDTVTRMDIAGLIVLLIAGSAWCWMTADRVGLTYDEPIYLIEGRRGWIDSTSTHLLKHGTMPLPIDVQSMLPSYFSVAPVDPPTEYILSQYRLARRANIVFWWVLIVHVGLLGWQLGGPWSGRIASALVAADPTILAHAALATTDLALAAMVLALTYHTVTPRQSRWWTIILPGVLFGLAGLSKFSGLLYGGLVLIVVEVWHRQNEVKPHASRWQTWLMGAIARVSARTFVAVTLVVLYCGWDSDRDRVASTVRQIVTHDDTAFGRLAHQHAARLPNAAIGLIFQIEQNRTGRGTFLLGQWHDRAVWHYFPVVLLLKFPDVPFVLLVLVAVTRPKSLLGLPLFLGGAWLLAVLPATIQLGIRLVLPIPIVTTVGVAVALVRGFPKGGPKLATLAIGVAVIVAVVHGPNGLQYSNRLAGGPTQTHRWLSDSNADWGQGIPELVRWHEQTGKPALAVWYFGSDPRAYTPAFAKVEIGGLSPTEVKQQLGPAFLAVGHTIATNDPSPSKSAVVAWLNRQTPVAKLPTWTIYDLRTAD